MMETGFVNVTTLWAEARAILYLKQERKREDKEKEACIQQKLNRRFFAAKTRDEALELCWDGLAAGYPWETRTGNFWKNEADKILISARHSSDGNLLLATSVVQWLENFYEDTDDR